MTAFSAPRLIRLEYQLNVMSKDGVPPATALEPIRQALARQADIQEEIGGPLVSAIIDEGGFQWMEGAPA